MLLTTIPFFSLMPLGVVITGTVLGIAALAVLVTGAFVGSQIDDRFDTPTLPIGGITKLPYYITLPLLIGVTVLTITIAKKYAKKL